MPHRAAAALPLVVLLAAATAACTSSPPSGPPSTSPSPSPLPSSAPPASPSPSPSPSASPDALLLRITSEGGFIGPSALLATLPEVSVYADGRIAVPGPVDAIYPGPLLAPVLIRNVGPSGAAAIEAAIEQAGLDRPAPPAPGVPGDLGTTVFTVIVDGQPVVSRFPGLVGGPPRPGVGSPDPASAAALSLLQRLQDPAETWGAASAPQSTYEPKGFRIWVAPGAPVADGSVTQTPVAWPLGTPLSDFGTPAVPDRGIAGLRQGVVLGQDAATLAPIFARATAITPFTSGGHSFTLYVRSLLPDELPAS